MFNLPLPLLLAISMAAALSVTVVNKAYVQKTKSGLTAPLIFNAVLSACAVLVFLVWGGLGKLSLYTVLLGAAFGAVVTLHTIANLKAFELGPMAYTSVIVSFSTLIPALSGTLFFDEPMIAPVQIVGIGLMLLSFFFAVERKKDEKSASWRWLAVSLLAFLLTGGIGVMQKIHQSSAHKDELNGFLAVAFLTAFVASAVAAILFSQKEKTPLFPKTEDGKISWVLIVFMLVCGVGTAFNHKLNLYLSGVMDSAVFFPLVNGGGLVLATLASVLIFRERPTLKQWLGVAVGILSVVCLCNPFA